MEMPTSAYIKEGDVAAYSSYLAPTPKKVVSKGERFVPFDDPSIDDFLEGSMDVDAFLSS
jgi:hypothetical protein